MRITERKFLEFPVTSLLVDGGEGGELQFLGAIQLRVGQILILCATGIDDIKVKVNRVVSATEVRVGPVDEGVAGITDVSDFTVALGANVRAQEQARPAISNTDVNRAVFEEEPIVAYRVISVDTEGNIVNAGQLQVEVDGESTNVNGDTCPDGSTSVRTTIQNDAFTLPWDDLEVTQERPDGQPEIIISRKGGVDQQQATLTYTAAGNFQRIVVVDL